MFEKDSKIIKFRNTKISRSSFFGSRVYECGLEKEYGICGFN